MKIEIDLKDITKHDLVQVLVNHELRAFSPCGSDDLHVKIVGCSKCGNCCMDVSPDHTEFGADDEGKCGALKKVGDKWECRAGSRLPFKCLPDPVDCDVIRYR